MTHIYRYNVDVVVERPFIVRTQRTWFGSPTWTHWCSGCQKWEPLDSQLIEHRHLQPMSKLEFLVLTGHTL